MTEKNIYTERLDFHNDIKSVILRACDFFATVPPKDYCLITVGFGDYNLKLIMPDDSQLVLKIFSKDRTTTYINRYEKIINTVIAGDICHPRVLRANNGKAVYHDNRYDTSMVLMEYIHGKPLTEYSTLPTAVYKNVIHEAVKISNITIDIPEYFDMWQVTNLAGLHEETEHILDSRINSRIKSVLEEYKDLAPLLPTGFVHGDMTRTNIISTANNVAILDFGASGIYPRIHELAILAAHCLADGKLSLDNCIDYTCKEFLLQGGTLSEFEMGAMPAYTQAILAVKYLCNVYEIDEAMETEEMVYWREISIAYLMADRKTTNPLQHTREYRNAYKASMWRPK